MATIDTIKNNRLAAQEELANKAKKDIVATMDEVGGSTKVCYNDDGTVAGISGGKYVQIPHGDTTIAADNVGDVLALEKEINKGLQGDGKYHRRVVINGCPCDCCGNTIAELEEDIRNAQKYADTHRELFGLVTAEQLVVAGYEKGDLKQVEVRDRTLFVSYSEKRIFDKEGKTVADLSDIEYNILSNKMIESMLIARADKVIEEEEAAYEEEYDDDYDDEWEDEEDEEDWDDEECDEEDDDEDDDDEDDDNDNGNIYGFMILRH